VNYFLIGKLVFDFGMVVFVVKFFIFWCDSLIIFVVIGMLVFGDEWAGREEKIEDRLF